MKEGSVVSIHIASEASAPMQLIKEVRAFPGRGLEGDRYFTGIGFYSKKPSHGGREVTLIETETVEALFRGVLNAAGERLGIKLTAAETRRNIATSGVPLSHLVDREFQVGAVRMRGTRLCEPCKHLEELTQPGVLSGLIHRGGLRALILNEGIIHVGDVIRMLDTQYDANYGNFQTSLYEEIRREAFGEDIGQTSWLTADEQDRFLKWLDLSPEKTLLDVACGAGGPALRIAAATGCSIVGIDVHEKAVAAASAVAAHRGLAERAEFQAADATQPLPFSDARFDAITCIDAINHLHDRERVIAEWARLLKPSGRLLFTDPTTVTGALTSAEIKARSSAGFYLFVPQGYNERIIAQHGLRLLIYEDVPANAAKSAEARRAARALRSAALREIEGDPEYARQQEFLAVAGRVAREGRLSRFVYVSQKLS